jgi:Ca-activated chloride channel family protein
MPNVPPAEEGALHIAAHLDVELIAVETDDQVSVMIEVVAPPPGGEGAHVVRTLEVVLDRSGSMRGARLDGAKQALVALVGRLDPRDQFGLVVFDSDVAVTVPAAVLGGEDGRDGRDGRDGKDKVRRAIAGVTAGGSTDLSGGYLRGLQEARRAPRCSSSATGTPTPGSPIPRRWSRWRRRPTGAA